MEVTGENLAELKLYFAYGSNLSLAQMKERCPGSKPVEAYTLTDHRLVFVGEYTKRWGQGGVATVIPQVGSNVPGAIYRLTPEDETRLDGFEGVNYDQPQLGSYYKEESRLLFNEEPVLTYIATSVLLEKGEYSPSMKYLGMIRQGYRDWGLPPDDLMGITTQSL